MNNFTFLDIKEQREQLGIVLEHWREYKDEYERISDWLQQVAILIKNQKIALCSNLEEKRKQVETVKELLKQIIDGRAQIDKLNDSAKILLKSPLETHVNNQLQQINSRYEVELNLGKDVLRKVENNFSQHQEYSENLERSRNWIDNAKELIRNSSEITSLTSKDVLQDHLNKIQNLIQEREIGQSLIHSTVNCGEKVLRNTRSDGKEVINAELKEIQNDWDRIVKKMSSVKVHLETALLQWADYDSSYHQLQQWINDREAKLQQVTETKISKTGKSGLSALPIGERKATLRETGSIVQDIVSFEPMIQSVTSKAEDLKQAKPASEISTKYENLSKQAQALYAKQKETIDSHQAFIDAGTDFVQWIRAARERLGQCSDPTGDKESLGSKLSKIKALQNDLPEGQKKLELALEKGDKACQTADDEDREIIEEEVGLLQDEFDNYTEMLTNSKTLLEVGLVKWTEYEEQYQEALKWLARKEEKIKSFNKLQNSLEDKRSVLEQFQTHLQTLFDWQSELDRLNMRAQALLETCSDTRISNAVTQLATKYGTILALAKENMRRLELHYQEHQQHSTLCQECQDWLDRTKEKLNSCHDIPNTLSEINNRLQIVKNIRASIEQGQNKLRYILELKERVMINTEKSGADKIEEVTENLNQDMEKLLVALNDARNKLSARASQLEEIEKLCKILSELLDDVETQLQPEEEFLHDFGERKGRLEKLKAISKELQSQSDLVAKIKNAIETNKVSGESYGNCLERYGKLSSDVAATIDTLEKQVSDYQEYKKFYDETTKWINEKQSKVRKCTIIHDELKDIEEKESDINSIVETLHEGEDLVHKTIELSILVLKFAGNEEQDGIKQEIDDLNNIWEGFQVLCTETQKSLVRCKDAWNDFIEIYNKFKTWIGICQNKLDALSKIDKLSPEDLDEANALLRDINNQKENLEHLIDSCDLVMEQSAVGWVRDKTVELQTTYTVQLIALQDLIAKSEKSLSDHKEFLQAKSNLEQWLFKRHGDIQDCVGVGDEASIIQKLATISQISLGMPIGQDLLNVLQAAFAKAINVVHVNQQESLREDVATLKKSWDQLNLDLASIQSQLKASLNRWKEYGESKEDLMKWMRNTEDILDEKYNTKGEYSEMKILSERYKNLKTEILGKRNDLDRLKIEAADLSNWSKNTAVVAEANQMESLYGNVLSKCERIRENIEVEIRDYNIYQQSLQEVEKWLLQTSFKLMNQNTLYITNKEQTEAQIKEQEENIQEIQKFQSNLDDVRSKGQILIDRYASASVATGTSIGKQLDNVQDSYDSLLKTALQIENRLLESLVKFKEYEATLEDIMKNLDVYEPKISEISAHPATNLEGAQQQLEVVKDLNDKLQGEKTRLAIAVQACESAASMSRPGSPRDIHPPPVPARELECRARLSNITDQDPKADRSAAEISLQFEHLEEPGMVKRLHPLLTKVQTCLGQLTSTVLELQEREKLKADLKDWIGNKRAVINDWKNKPTKLRSDAAKQDLDNMNELLLFIGQRKQHLLTDFSDSDTSELETLLDSLEAELSDLIAQRQSHQELIHEYRQNLQSINNWFDSLSKQVEAVDKGSGLNCQQKQSSVFELKIEFDEKSPKKMETVKTLAATIISLVNNLDSQQIEEQMKSLERKYNDVQKKLQRKLQILEMTQKGIDDTKNEIERAGDWVKSKLVDLRKQEPLGFEVYKADDRLNSLKALLKETDNKNILKDTLLKRVNNMVNELEPSEKTQLEDALKNLGNDLEELIESIRKEIDKTIAAGNTRRNLESNLEKAKVWLKSKNAEVRKLSGYLPLQSTEVKRDIDQQQAHETEIKVFGEGDFNDLVKLGNSVLKECNKEDKERLQAILDEIKDDYESLKQESNQKIKALTDLYQGRREFENDINDCINWLKEADVATKAEIRAPNLENLEEQLTKYLKLSEESKGVQNNIEKITEQGKAILPTISEADKYTLNQTLENMKDWHKRIDELIKDRTDQLKQNILQLRDAKNKIAESIQFINDIQSQLKDLNKPVGSKVEDVKNVLSIYENILKDLKANKDKLNDIPGSEELQNVMSTQDELIKSIEDQIARLRQLLLLREQFIALVTEIMTFITKYTEIIRDIEKVGGTVDEKIKKYDDVIVRIQECEALLASAYDKGQQIATDCSVQDQNSITEQLQSLKNSLLTLRRAVEKQRQEHENTAAEHKKFAAALEEILDYLHVKEGKAKSRPLLERNIGSVDKEIEEHKKFAKEILGYLDKIRSIQQATKNDDSMPSSLLEQLSEANSLLNSLPKELEDREKYLLANREMREKYEALKKKFFDWIKEAEIRLESYKEGVDFENILTDLEEHKIFFSTENSIKELVSVNIQKAADEIWSSLTSGEQEELSREQQHLTQTLKNTLNSAKSQRARMEQSGEIWKEYCQSLDKVKSVISRTRFIDEPVSTLAGLHFNIQKISHALNDIQNQQFDLDLLLQRVSEISQQADERNIKNIEKQSREVSNEWASLISDLEVRRETLTKLAQIWDTFEGRWQNFESLLTGIEERSKHVETIVRNKEHELQSEADSLEDYKNEIEELSKNILVFLNEVSKTSSNVLTEKLSQLNKTYEGLKEHLSNQKTQIATALETIENCLSRISDKKVNLEELKEEAESFYVYDHNTSLTENSISDLRTRIESEVQSTKILSQDIKELYRAQGLLPSDIAQELNQLELVGETVLNIMEEKDREFKKARTVRTDYLNDVEEVQSWIKDAELKIQDRSIEPQILHEYLQKVQGEISGVGDRLEKLTKNGKTIADKTKDDKEKQVILSTITELTEQLQQVKSWLDEKRQQVNEILDSWDRFLALHRAVMSWVEEKKVFLQESLHLSTLQEAKQKLHDYNNAVKSCKVATKNLSEMVKELESIGNVTSVGDLPKKMEQAEEAKTEVEAQILERNGLLQETSEEWEQCERKMRDVKNWIEKTRTALDSQQNKKKALRDQHALREKMLADIHIQKTKISLSVEKLQLHFRAGISGEANITETAQELLDKLDSLNETINQETLQLETAIAQVDQYQEEVQQLRQQIVQVEQQLRTAMAPVHLADDKDEALREQQASRMQDCQQRIKLLTMAIQRMDPYNTTEVPASSMSTLDASYADIAAGRSKSTERYAADNSRAHDPIKIPHLDQPMTNQTKTVNESQKTTISVVTPSNEPEILVEHHPQESALIPPKESKMKKLEMPRKSRSPRRRGIVKEKKIDLDTPASSLPKLELPEEDNEFKIEVTHKEPTRFRSPSPMWKPGSIPYADVLKGLHPSENTSTTIENVIPIDAENQQQSIVPPNQNDSITSTSLDISTRQHSESRVAQNALWNTQPVASNYTTTQLPQLTPFSANINYYNNVPQSATYYNYIPVPEMFGFVASGQQLINSGLGTYHTSTQCATETSTVYGNDIYETRFTTSRNEEDIGHIEQSTENLEKTEESQKLLEVKKDEERTEIRETTPSKTFSYAHILSQGLDKPFQPSSTAISMPKDKSPKSGLDSRPKDEKTDLIYANKGERSTPYVDGAQHSSSRKPDRKRRNEKNTPLPRYTEELIGGNREASATPSKESKSPEEKNPHGTHEKRIRKGKKIREMTEDEIEHDTKIIDIKAELKAEVAQNDQNLNSISSRNIIENSTSQKKNGKQKKQTQTQINKEEIEAILTEENRESRANEKDQPQKKIKPKKIIEETKIHQETDVVQHEDNLELSSHPKSLQENEQRKEKDKKQRKSKQIESSILNVENQDMQNNQKPNIPAEKLPSSIIEENKTRKKDKKPKMEIESSILNVENQDMQNNQKEIKIPKKVKKPRMKTATDIQNEENVEIISSKITIEGRKTETKNKKNKTLRQNEAEAEKDSIQQLGYSQNEEAPKTSSSQDVVEINETQKKSKKQKKQKQKEIALEKENHLENISQTITSHSTVGLSETDKGDTQKKPKKKKTNVLEVEINQNEDLVKVAPSQDQIETTKRKTKEHKSKEINILEEKTSQESLVIQSEGTVELCASQNEVERNEKQKKSKKQKKPKHKKVSILENGNIKTRIQLLIIVPMKKVKKVRVKKWEK
ncbi:hypothetical protein HHI36_007323 [Cryptolaemus montrouzieri]|uniref:Nesprin-1 spectrin repeats region domain-containing protein n=1 Tax=Cryptolaemus montrouzieri TaxID=559131 RepID=A0ABD2MPB5_9CUCU